MGPQTAFTQPPLPATSSGAAPARESIRKLQRLTAQWRRRAAFRADLRRLLKAGPHLARDVGLDPEDAHREAAKPFWRA